MFRLSCNGSFDRKKVATDRLIENAFVYELSKTTSRPVLVPLSWLLHCAPPPQVRFHCSGRLGVDPCCYRSIQMIYKYENATIFRGTPLGSVF